MRRVRVIPVLLLQDGGLIKTERFKNPRYIGDPLNAVRIFNEKEVDEIVLLDIKATQEKREPDYTRIKEIVSEAFMPLAYGGGITTVSQMQQLIECGVEKIVLGSSAYNMPSLVSQAAKMVGSQSVVVCLDVKKNWFGRNKVYVQNGSINTHEDPVDFACRMADAGAGEIFLQSIDADGSFSGYDLKLIKTVAEEVDIPVVAIGGAASIDDFKKAVAHGASAVAAGSMFVMQKPHRAVLISYPSSAQLKEQFYSNL